MFFQRFLRALKLEPSLYREVKADRAAMGQSLLVVVVVALVFLAFIPLVGEVLALFGSAWSLLAIVVAVRETLGVAMVRAIGAAVVGLVVVLVVSATLVAHGLGIGLGIGPGLTLY